MKRVDVYTWQTCPFCRRAKALMTAAGIAYREHPIDGDSAALQGLKEKSGIASVPQIFVDDQFIGGCDDLQRLYDEGKFAVIFGLSD